MLRLNSHTFSEVTPSPVSRDVIVSTAIFLYVAPMIQTACFDGLLARPSIAQLVEHLTVDQRVLSSNLGGRILLFRVSLDTYFC